MSLFYAHVVCGSDTSFYELNEITVLAFESLRHVIIERELARCFPGSSPKADIGLGGAMFLVSCS